MITVWISLSWTFSLTLSMNMITAKAIDFCTAQRIEIDIKQSTISKTHPNYGKP